MTTELEFIDHGPRHIAPRASIFNLEPEQQIVFAAKIATTLKDVITKQKLSRFFNGKEYVMVEGWEVLGTFLGVLPKERVVNELSDGSYEAFVDLVRSSDGVIIGGASAICGIDEKRWGSADRYARRSMAITRAVGKAYRTSFSWIISLAGYQPTPFEEMPGKEESYLETKDQQEILKGYAAEFKITAMNALIELSKAVRGKPMSELREAVRSYIEVPL